jgi:hypothetical protein
MKRTAVTLHADCRQLRLSHETAVTLHADCRQLRLSYETVLLHYMQIVHS